MSSTMTELKAAGQLALRTLSRRLRKGIEPPPDMAAFSSEMEVVLVQAPDSLVRSYHWLQLPADQPPWVDANVQLARGMN